MIKLNKSSMAMVLLAGLSLVACNDKKAGVPSGDAPVVKADDRPQPLKVYTAGGVSVNAYDFEKLEYFLKQKNDTTYVVNFWATWCVPCVEELPNFEKLNEKYRDDKVKVILVSLDMAKMIDTKLIPFIKKNQLKSDVVVLRDTDADSWIPKVDSTWTGAIPATVIYNKDRRKFYEKPFTFDELEKEVSNFK